MNNSGNLLLHSIIALALISTSGALTAAVEGAPQRKNRFTSEKNTTPAQSSASIPGIPAHRPTHEAPKVAAKQALEKTFVINTTSKTSILHHTSPNACLKFGDYQGKSFIIIKPNDSNKLERGVAPFTAYQVVVFPALTRSKLLEQAIQYEKEKFRTNHAQPQACLQSQIAAHTPLIATGIMLGGMARYGNYLPNTLKVLLGLGGIGLTVHSELNIEHHDQRKNLSFAKALHQEHLANHDEEVKIFEQKFELDCKARHIPLSEISEKHKKELFHAYGNQMRHNMIARYIDETITPHIALEQAVPFFLTQAPEMPLWVSLSEGTLLQEVLKRLDQYGAQVLMKKGMLSPHQEINITPLVAPSNLKDPFLSQQARALLMKSCNLATDQEPLVLVRSLDNAKDCSTTTILSILGTRKINVVAAQKPISSPSDVTVASEQPPLIIDGVTLQEFAHKMHATLPNILFREHKNAQKEKPLPLWEWQKVIQDIYNVTMFAQSKPASLTITEDLLDPECDVTSKLISRSAFKHDLEKDTTILQYPWYRKIDFKNKTAIMQWHDKQAYPAARWTKPKQSIIPQKMVIAHPNMPPGQQLPPEIQRMIMAQAAQQQAT